MSMDPPMLFNLLAQVCQGHIVVFSFAVLTPATRELSAQLQELVRRLITLAIRITPPEQIEIVHIPPVPIPDADLAFLFLRPTKHRHVRLTTVIPPTAIFVKTEPALTLMLAVKTIATA